MDEKEKEWILNDLNEEAEISKEKYSLAAEVIAEAVSDYKFKLGEKTLFLHEKAIEQFAIALTWKLIHPDVQPPSCCENRTEKEEKKRKANLEPTFGDMIRYLKNSTLVVE